MDRELRAGVQSIVRQAIAAVLPDEAVRRALASFTPGPGRVLLVAAGKAAWQMARAALEVLPRVDGGAVITKYGHARGALPGVPKKPAPQGTLALMEAIGAQAASTLYVGDSNVDVCTGKNAGLRCCGVLWGFRTEDELREAGADYLAADAAALEQVILAGG